MSTLKVDAIRHNSATSDAITTAADGTCSAKLTSVGGGQLSHRNVIINGAMAISQRGSTFSHAGSSNTNILTMDRWKVRRSGSEFDTTITHSTDSPDGFSYSLKITPDAVETPSAGQNGLIMQQIEGQNLQHFAYGTSSAKSVTVSFYAKSGSQNNGDTYSFQMRKYDSSNNNKIVTKAFTVTSSWQRFTMTFPGDTSNDIKNSTNYQGFEFIFHLATGPDDLVAAQPTWTSTYTNWRGVTGQSNFMDNTNNEFYLTGCQLEVGDTATTFEHRTYQDEFLRCSRYFYFANSQHFFIGRGNNSDSVVTFLETQVPLRSTPSVTLTGNLRHYGIDSYSDSSTTPTVPSFRTNQKGIRLNQSGHSGVNDDCVLTMQCSGSDGQGIFLDAEI